MRDWDELTLTQGKLLILLDGGRKQGLQGLHVDDELLVQGVGTAALSDADSANRHGQVESVSTGNTSLCLSAAHTGTLDTAVRMVEPHSSKALHTLEVLINVCVSHYNPAKEKVAPKDPHTHTCWATTQGI